MYYRIGNDESAAELIETKSFGSSESAMFTAPETYNDEPFVCWMKDGNVISYDVKCGMLVYSDMSICAVYGSDIEVGPSILLSGSVYDADDGTQKFKYIASRAVPDGFELVEHGLIRADSSTYGHDSPENRERASAGLFMENAGVEQYGITVFRSTKLQPYGDFMSTKTIRDIDFTTYAKAYLIYRKDGVLTTIYSDMVVLTNVAGLSFTITWNNYDGSLIKTTTVAKGETPSYPETTDRCSRSTGRSRSGCPSFPPCSSTVRPSR